MINFAEMLYQRLPEIYKEQDKDLTVPYQLQRFLKVLGEGFNEFGTYITDYNKLFDVKNTTSAALNGLIKMQGFTFPYSMTEEEKRKLIKILPILYENKGNAKVFGYLARLVFGADVVVTLQNGISSECLLVSNDFELSNTFYIIGSEKQIVVNITFMGNIAFDDCLSKFLILAENFRPINTIIYFNFTAIYEKSIEIALDTITSLSDFRLRYWDTGSGVSSWDTNPPDVDINDDGVVTLLSRRSISASDVTFVDEDNNPTDQITNKIQITQTLGPLIDNGELREIVIWNEMGDIYDTASVIDTSFVLESDTTIDLNTELHDFLANNLGILYETDLEVFANLVHYLITKTSNFALTRKLRLTYTLV